ncbi:helix-turn-helix domain-containing protein, partial [Vibrio minamisatsumaniensis]|uniref:helix-turn-helix domain-containing protein n=1 Tax=Vibrio minamisatsumaniensis TaxID=2910243 RepID=UPI003D1DE612
MKVNKFDLQLVKYITQNEISSFSSLEQYFEKDKATIYRSLQRSFSYISKYKHLSQPTVPNLFDIEYSDYIRLINTLDLASYKPNQKQRVECVILMLIFNKVMSKQEIYKIIGVSVSTLKNDTQILSQVLARANLSLVTHRRKGTELTGNELGIRLLVTMQLIKLSQLDQNLCLNSKITNNPIEKILFDVFYNKCSDYLTVSKEQLTRVISDKKVSLDYNSRKFMMIYLIVSNFRVSQGHKIERKNLPKLPWHDSVLLEEKSDNENRVLSSIFYSLTFKKGQYLCYDSKLLKAVREFLTSIQRNFITDIKDSLALESDIYLLMKNIISRKKLGFNFSENKHNDIYKTK